jgi:alanine racemase
MVKANAYGLGAVPCAGALEELDPWGFGVATVAEGVELRDAGISRPILVFTPATAAQQADYRRYDLRAVLDRAEAIAAWDRPFHLEIDTGMGRCGVRWDDASQLAGCGSPHLEGVFTHFYAADSDASSVETQQRRFLAARERLPSVPNLVHAANSAGAWRLREPLDLVRPGIFLYGGCHARDLDPPRPVAALRAPVVGLRRIPTGESVSYGGDWRAPRDTWVATLGVGYADGVPRSVQSKAEVLLGGVRRPVVGRVTMDFIMIDTGPHESAAAIGEVATIFGGPDPAAPSVDEFGEWAGSNAYEILARIGARVVKRYDGGAG